MGPFRFQYVHNHSYRMFSLQWSALRWSVEGHSQIDNSRGPVGKGQRKGEAVRHSLYVLSDTLIAVNKFVINSENTWALHMATYFMAQFLLTDSSLVPLSKQVSAQNANNNNNNNRGLGSRSLSSDMAAFMRAWWRANNEENQATNTAPNNPPHPTPPTTHTNTKRNTTNTDHSTTYRLTNWALMR